MDLVRRFEPILYFHPEEKFFPCDAKSYIEHSALSKLTAGNDGMLVPAQPVIQQNRLRLWRMRRKPVRPFAVRRNLRHLFSRAGLLS
jgi:hypothetical protein